MSHIGKQIILVPKNIHILLTKSTIQITGQYGSMNQQIFNNFQIIYHNYNLMIVPKNNSVITKKKFGLFRTLIQNMIIGVNSCFSKTLILEGIGYKFYTSFPYLTLNIGLTQNINILVPNNIIICLESSVRLLVKSISNEILQSFCSNIRSFKKPNKYKKKGIYFLNEHIILKKIKKI